MRFRLKECLEARQINEMISVMLRKRRKRSLDGATTSGLTTHNIMTLSITIQDATLRLASPDGVVMSVVYADSH